MDKWMKKTIFVGFIVIQQWICIHIEWKTFAS